MVGATQWRQHHVNRPSLVIPVCASMCDSTPAACIIISVLPCSLPAQSSVGASGLYLDHARSSVICFSFALLRSCAQAVWVPQFVSRSCAKHSDNKLSGDCSLSPSAYLQPGNMLFWRHPRASNSNNPHACTLNPKSRASCLNGLWS